MSLRLRLEKSISVLALLITAGATPLGCSHLPRTPLLAETPPSPCANIDWYELGRLDGLSGASLEKMEEQKERCLNSPKAFDQELYVNGRNSGLAEFCSPTGGLEAGKNGVEYENVCPAHQEPEFLANHRLGSKIRQLESENEELEDRIANLSRLISPSSPSPSIRSQIENLRDRRAQNNLQIINLEGQADTDAGTGHF